MAGSRLLVAKSSFACEVNGREYLVRKGVTRVRADHPLVKGRKELFEPAELRPDIEQPTAERRGRKRQTRR
jgi:hypothetical protein